MSHLELKGGILEVVSALEKQDVLQRIFEFVKQAASEEEERLSTGRIEKIQKAVAHVKSGGEMVAHEDVMQNLKNRAV